MDYLDLQLILPGCFEFNPTFVSYAFGIPMDKDMQHLKPESTLAYH